MRMLVYFTWLIGVEYKREHNELFFSTSSMNIWHYESSALWILNFLFIFTNNISGQPVLRTECLGAQRSHSSGQSVHVKSKVTKRAPPPPCEVELGLQSDPPPRSEVELGLQWLQSDPPILHVCNFLILNIMISMYLYHRFSWTLWLHAEFSFNI